MMQQQIDSERAGTVMSPPTPSKLLRAAAILDMPVETLRERLSAPSALDHPPSGDMTQVFGQQRDITDTMLAQSVEERCTQVDDLSHNQDQTEFTNLQAGQLDLGTRFSPKDFSADYLTAQLIGNSEEDAQGDHDVGNMMNGIGEALHVNSSNPSLVHTILESSSRDISRWTEIDIEWPSAEILRAEPIETPRESTRRASTNTTSSLVILTPSSSSNSTLPNTEPTSSLLIPTPSSSGNSVNSDEVQSLAILKHPVASEEADEALVQKAAMLGPCSRIWNIPPVS